MKASVDLHVDTTTHSFGSSYAVGTWKSACHKPYRYSAVCILV